MFVKEKTSAGVPWHFLVVNLHMAPLLPGHGDKDEEVLSRGQDGEARHLTTDLHNCLERRVLHRQVGVALSRSVSTGASRGEPGRGKTYQFSKHQLHDQTMQLPD